MSRFFLALLGISSLHAAPMKISPSLFQNSDFKQRFVGSYGFLPEVEPKVDREEGLVIAELSELLSLSRFKQAEKRLLDFISERKNPTDPEKEAKGVSAALIFTLGNLYFQNGRIDDAEKAYKIAIKRHEAYRRAYKNLALLYASNDQIEKAKPNLMKAIEYGDADHRTFGLLGVAYLKEEKALAAEAAYRQAYLLNPTEKDWKLGLAQALLLKESWTEAASMLQTLIDENPDDALLWKQQANCYIQDEDMTRAAENYEALRLKGLADEESLNQLGDIYSREEQPLLALGAYLSAMKQAETVKIPRSLKAAKYLLQLGAPKEAARLTTEMRKLAGDAMTTEQKVAALKVESDIAKADENLAAATTSLEKALELDPANGEARVGLAQLYAERAAEEDNPDFKVEAKSYLKVALTDTDPKVAFQANLRFAQLLVKDSRYLDALPKLEQAVRLKKGSKRSIEQYLRRVQRAAEREKAKKEREELLREEKREQEQKAQEKKEKS